MTWGSNFAEDYVSDELTAQNVFFPDQAALEEDGRSDLVQYAGEQVTTGAEAEAYASFIDGHLADIADGATYADLGGPEREANAAVTEAQESGADEATVAELQATADEISGQRQSLFRGETLRGLLLSTFAWSTIGRIAGIAAIVAFVAAAAMRRARRPRSDPPPPDRDHLTPPARHTDQSGRRASHSLRGSAPGSAPISRPGTRTGSRSPPGSRSRPRGSARPR